MPVEVRGEDGLTDLERKMKQDFEDKFRPPVDDDDVDLTKHIVNIVHHLSTVDECQLNKSKEAYQIEYCTPGHVELLDSDLEFVNQLIKIMEHPRFPICREHAIRFLNQVSLNLKNKSIIFGMGVCSTVMKYLESKSVEEEGIVVQSMIFLNSHAVNKESLIAMADLGIIPLVSNLLKSSSDQVRYFAGNCLLRFVAANDSYKVKFTELDAVTSATAMLDSKGYAVQELGILVILALVTSEAEKNTLVGSKVYTRVKPMSYDAEKYGNAHREIAKTLVEILKPFVSAEEIKANEILEEAAED